MSETAQAATCRMCQQVIQIHPPTGLWVSARDVITGVCEENPLTGNYSDVRRHIPEDTAARPVR